MLVIADARRAAGGRRRHGRRDVRSHRATTRTIVLESAYFKPASVRRTSKRLGLKTEASSRFERGADIDAPVAGASSARCALLRADRRRPRRRARRRPLSARRAPTDAAPAARRASRALLGLAVPDADVERILASLGLRA